MSNFASRVIEARTDKGWSSEELAEKAGMDPKAIENIESGRILLGRKYPQLAAALGVSLEWLSSGQEINPLSTSKASAPTKEKKLPPANSVGGRLIAALTTSGMKVGELADLLEMNPSTLSQLIRGRNHSSRRIGDIAEALDVSKRWLLTGKEDEALTTLEKNPLKQQLLNVIAAFSTEQMKQLIDIAKVLGQSKVTESAKAKTYEDFQKHPLLQSDNAVVKKRKPPARTKKAS